MSVFKSFVLVTFLSSSLIISCSTEQQATPAADTAHAGEHLASTGAEGMAGAKGTFEFKPSDWQEGQVSWWKDTDGVAPGVAGCHIGTDENGQANGRLFGEACLDNGWLVESNPGAEELHSHQNDIGHPDTFDCNSWCTSKGNTTGVCEVAAAPPCTQSAVCTCR